MFKKYLLPIQNAISVGRIAKSHCYVKKKKKKNYCKATSAYQVQFQSTLPLFTYSS